MAGRMDERGYAENVSSRQREPFAGQDYQEEPARRSARGGARRDERDFEQDYERHEMRDDRRFVPREREPAPLRVTASLSDAFVTAFERGAAVMSENLRLYQDETVRFVAERLEHDTQMLEELGKSRSMFDLLTIQQRWLSAATRAYSEEWMRLSRLTNGGAQRAAGEARAAMSETRRAAYDAQ